MKKDYNLFIGKKKSFLTIVSIVKIPLKNNTRNMFNCVCDCGNHRNIRPDVFFNPPSKTISCGCARIAKSKTGIQKSKKMYYVHRDMKSRCYNDKNKRFYRYGGRGIIVCDRWLHSLDNFIEDMGYPEEGMQLDRIDNDGNYDPSNCKWSTRQEQNANRGGKFSKKNVTN